MVLEGDADDSVERPTEVELAHVRDRCDLGKRETPVAVQLHVRQRAAYRPAPRREPEVHRRLGQTRAFRNLDEPLEHAALNVRYVRPPRRRDSGHVTEMPPDAAMLQASLSLHGAPRRARGRRRGSVHLEQPGAVEHTLAQPVEVVRSEP